MASDIQPAVVEREQNPCSKRNSWRNTRYLPGDTWQRRNEIFDEVCNYFELSRRDLWGDDRRPHPAFARMVVYWLLHDHLGMNYCRVGRFMKRDRTTVMYGITKARRRREIQIIGAHILRRLIRKESQEDGHAQ